jgi:hypothetical protein
MPQLGATMKDIERLERQIKEVREAVLAMAIALSAALLGTGDTTRTLNALIATQGEIGTGQETHVAAVLVTELGLRSEVR